jgi:hypothetical protein
MALPDFYIVSIPWQATSLMKKPEADLYVPPKNLDAAHRIMKQNRWFCSMLQKLIYSKNCRLSSR